MDFLEDIRLVDGPVLWTAWAVGVGGLAYLLWRCGRRHTVGVSAAVLSAALLLAAALVAGSHLLLIYVLSVFPEELPWEVLAWSVPAVAALLLWLLRLHGIWGRKPFLASVRSPARPVPHRARSTAAATAALVGAVVLSAVQVNAYFGLNHTVSDLTGTAVARIPVLEEALKRHPGESRAVSLADWTAPEGLPADGTIRKASIPGTVSGFRSRDAYIYFPPAYQGSPKPALPVLVLFAGQPGTPADWLTGGALRSRMDRFAAGHGGVAPVVVVVDPNGTPSGNTLCMDSRIAQADTFLAQDVPAWIRNTFDVDPDPAQWAAGGFSFGATCAIQMVTRHPDIYSAALAFSSEKEPALAKERQKTIEGSFGGDTAAFERLTPLRLMQERRFDGKAVYFAAGERDPEFLEYMTLLSAAARKAGFTVESHRVANAGHSWETASKALPGGLDFLATRWGIRP
ncbi:alpha/beta hydrolase family protein [Arthrobacter sp. B3I4]|uniref:alpha/beta hydrolase n=1 Tax=Arthrobacter sp. B3I4 TaxID=3042267 RepID=UPI002785EB98|nr:alpha/beta hydrolase-fold protein [Arthrobacter sp. B3I4]MDQ0755861.1 S-formylglutathione hydrolase FrmB [Arthrobacter sp. B3I4]